MIDSELNGIAVNVLKNSLYRALEKVMTAHFAAAKGLQFDPNEFYEVHAFDSGVSDEEMGIYTEWKGELLTCSCGHETLAGALEHASAEKIYCGGLLVFERRDGEWYYVGG